MLCRNRQNPDDYEILVAVGAITGHARKFLLLDCYLSPNYSKNMSDGALEHINDLIINRGL